MDTAGSSLPFPPADAEPETAGDDVEVECELEEPHAALATARPTRSTKAVRTMRSAPVRPDQAAGGPSYRPAIARHQRPAQVHLADGESELHALERAVALPRAHRLRAHAGGPPGIDDHEVGVEPGRNRALALLQARERRRRLRHPPRSTPHVAGAPGELETADVKGLDARAACEGLPERRPLLGIGVRRVIRGDHRDHSVRKPLHQGVTVMDGTDRGKHLHRVPNPAEVLVAKPQVLRAGLERQRGPGPDRLL